MVVVYIAILTLVTSCIAVNYEPYGKTWETLTRYHMFPYGSDVGDEKIGREDLPVVRGGFRKPWPQIKIFMDGHLELHHATATTPTTPYIAPFYLPYSQVEAGHVWFRTTQDTSTLNKLKSEIQTNFPDDGFVSDPDGMFVVTWEFEDVTPVYPECFPENRNHDVNPDFCACLEKETTQKYPHLGCECSYLRWDTRLYPIWPMTFYCENFDDQPNYRFELCWKGASSRIFDHHNFCTCHARGKSSAVGTCSANSKNIFFLTVPRELACELCDCDFPAKAYCFFKYLGKMHSFLLHVAGMAGPYCWYDSGHFHSLCPLLQTCQNATTYTPEICGCVMPNSLSEPDLMMCVLAANNSEYIWLCDDDVDLEYCKCIGDRSANDVDDEIYCKCAVASAGGKVDLCQCLSDKRYNGTESCSQSPVSAPSSWTTEVYKEEPVNKPMNVFQAAVVYNEWQTFVYFTYQRLEYSDTHVQTRIGYMDTSSAFSGYDHPYPDHPMLLHFLLFHSNIDVEGRWLYKLGRDVTQPHWIPENNTSILFLDMLYEF